MQALFKLVKDFSLQYENIQYEMDSGHKNEKIGSYAKSLRPFLRIVCVVDDFIYARRRNCSSAPGDLARNELF